MLNATITITNAPVPMNAVSGIVVSGLIRTARVGHREKHRCYCPSAKQSEFAALSEPSWLPPLSSSERLLKVSPLGTQQRSEKPLSQTEASRLMPAPMWGRMVILGAMSS